jgi:PIN domain nuclease of toxin-antitoxin system
MNYLLDTHIVVWWLMDSQKIVPKVREIIADKTNEIFVSSVSLWEMAIKQSIGRLTIPKNIIEVLIKEGFEMLPLMPEESLSVSDLPFIHNDPFDRMLIIQAKLNNLVLITDDSKIIQYPVLTLKSSER